jgi:hypothetical protein
VKAIADDVGPPDPDKSLLRENARLWRKSRILKDSSRARKPTERLFSRRMWELPERATQVFAAQKP